MKKMMMTIITLLLTCLLGVGVSSAFPPGYSLEQTGTGFAALSNDQSVSPTTSVRMGTVLNSDRAAIVFSGGPLLNSINQLSYWSYAVGRGDFDQLTAWIAIYLHTQPGKTYADWVTDYTGGSTDVFYIQAEPVYATGDPVLNTWEKQDAFDTTDPLKWVGLESPDFPYEAPTLSDYISGAAVSFPTPFHGTQSFASREYGTLYISAIKIRMGSGGPWANTLAYVDDVTIEDYFENFEPPAPVPANKDACKKGGWQALTRADFTPFKNQGDCIQYVNTGK